MLRKVAVANRANARDETPCSAVRRDDDVDVDDAPRNDAHGTRAFALSVARLNTHRAISRASVSIRDYDALT